MKRKGVEPIYTKDAPSVSLKFWVFQVRLMVQKIGISCKNLFLDLKFTCDNIVLDNLTLLTMYGSSEVKSLPG